jgi:hypothetical protein
MKSLTLSIAPAATPDGDIQGLLSPGKIFMIACAEHPLRPVRLRDEQLISETNTSIFHTKYDTFEAGCSVTTQQGPHGGIK